MRKISLNKIIKSNIFILIFLFLHFVPQIIIYAPSLKKLNLYINYLQIMFDGIFLFVIIFSKKRKESNTRTIVTLIIFYFFTLIISSLVNNESIAHTSYTLFHLSVFCMYVSTILNDKSDTFIKIGFYYLFLIVLVNFIIMIIYPNGLYMTEYYHHKIYFLGFKNGFYSIIIVLAVFSKISYNNKIIKKGIYIFSNIMAILTMLISNSSTGLIAFFTFLILNFLQLKKKTFFSLYKYSIILCLVISVSVSVFRFQDYASDLIFKIFGKSTTLTGRTYIWDSAIQMIGNKPILGYGLNLKNGIIKQGETYYYSHNLLLEIMLSGGIIAILIFLKILMYMSKKIKNSSKYNSNEYCILSAIIAYMIMGIAEAPITAKGLYMLIIFSVYYAEQISDNNNKVEGEEKN